MNIINITDILLTNYFCITDYLKKINLVYYIYIYIYIYILYLPCRFCNVMHSVYIYNIYRNKFNYMFRELQ